MHMLDPCALPWTLIFNLRSPFDPWAARPSSISSSLTAFAVHCRWSWVLPGRLLSWLGQRQLAQRVAHPLQLPQGAGDPSVADMVNKKRLIRKHETELVGQSGQNACEPG